MRKKWLLFLSVLCLALAALGAACGETAKFYVTVKSEEEGGNVSLSAPKSGEKYEKGEEVTVTVTVNGGYRLVSFTVGGADKLPFLQEEKYVFSVEEDTVVAAKFEKEGAEDPEDPDDPKDPEEPENSLDEALFSTLKRQIRLSGTYFHDEDGSYFDSTENIVTVFGDSVLYRSSHATSGELVFADLYVERDGKLAKVTHDLMGKATFEESDELFSAHANPFGSAVSATDFKREHEIGNTYLLRDLSKADEILFRITGRREKATAFTLYTSRNAVTAITVSAEGSENNFAYTAEYDLQIAADDTDFAASAADYTESAAHADLKAALTAADKATSYKIAVKEDDEFTGGTIEYNYYVTENAVYCDEAGSEIGYVLMDDGYVYAFDLDENGRVSFADTPFMRDYFDENGEPAREAVRDIATMQAKFLNFAAALLESKGNGTFALRENDASLANLVANLFAEGDDQLYLTGFATTFSLTVADGKIGTVEFDTAIYGFCSHVVYTYSAWDETELPVEIDTSAIPTPTVSIPAKFHGSFEGGEGVRYAVTITETNVSVLVNGAEATVTGVSYDEAENKISLTVNGEACVIEAGSSSAASLDVVVLVKDGQRVTLNRM